MNDYKIFCNYVLLIMKPSGFITRRYFESYDEIYDYSIYLQFSPNVVYAKGLERSRKKWKTLFNIKSKK